MSQNSSSHDDDAHARVVTALKNLRTNQRLERLERARETDRKKLEELSFNFALLESHVLNSMGIPQCKVRQSKVGVVPSPKSDVEALQHRMNLQDRRLNILDSQLDALGNSMLELLAMVVQQSSCGEAVGAPQAEKPGIEASSSSGIHS